MGDLRQLAASARQRLADGQQQLNAAWREKRDSAALLGGRAALVDKVLQDVLQALAMPAECALAAVGGYGRGQLYPGSWSQWAATDRPAATGPEPGSKASIDSTGRING